MTAPMTDASLVGQQKLEEQDLVRFKMSMDALKKRLSEPDTKDKQLRKACRNFEAVFIGKLWEQMRATVPKEGYLHSPQEDAYLSMFDQAFSEKMADSGGMGLADMLYGHLKERLAEMGRQALPGRLEVPSQVIEAPAADAAPAAGPAAAQVSEAPAVKSLAESGRDARQAAPVRETPLQPMGRRQNLKPLHAGPQLSPLVRPGSRFAPQNAPSAAVPSAAPSSAQPLTQAAPSAPASPEVAETPAQVQAQLEELVRRIEAQEQQAAGQAAEQPAAVPPAAAPQQTGVRVYRGQQTGMERPGRKLAKIG